MKPPDEDPQVTIETSCKENPGLDVEVILKAGEMPSGSLSSLHQLHDRFNLSSFDYDMFFVRVT